MKNLASIIGWLLLVAVLAVPSFLFYSWRARSKQQAAAEIVQEPAPSNIFTQHEKDQSARRQPDVTARQGAPAAAQPEPRPPAAGPVVLLATAAVQPVQADTGAAQAVSVPAQLKPVSYYTPKGDRDPTLSPADYSRMQELELQRLETERLQRLAERRKPKTPQFESRLRLQGIVGNAAIINGEMYSVGQTIYGARIIKIGANYVIGEYKGRKFRKVLQ